MIGEQIAILTLLVWLLVGGFGYIADKIEYFEVINVPMVTFIAFAPFLPFVFHWCGLC